MDVHTTQQEQQLARELAEAFGDFAFATSETALCIDSGADSLCSLFSSGTDSDGASPLPPSTEEEHTSHALPPTKKLKTSARTGSTKRPRKHNRLEILRLRDEVEALQTQLEKLRGAKDAHGSSGFNSQQPSSSPATRAVSLAVAAQLALRGVPKPCNASDAMALGAPRSVWFDLAVEQYAHLQQSEMLNKKLRAAVKKQLKLSEAVQVLLRKKLVTQELVAPPAQTMAIAPSQFSAPLKIADLHESLQMLFARAPVVSRAIELSNNTSSAFNSSRTKQDVVSGPSLEITTSTPVACDFRGLGEMVWKSATNNLVRVKYAGDHPTITNSYERQTKVTFSSQYGDINVVGKCVSRKFEDASRIVLAFVSRHSVSGTDLIVHEHSWVIVADSFVDNETEFAEWSAAPTAHFQTLYRLFSEKKDAASASGSSPFTCTPDPRTKHIQEIVTKGLGDRMHEHALRLQNLILAEMEIVTARNAQFRMPTLLCPCS